mmetsp:Transcript_12395/g.35453  ORF Transcript_12395/g.35453 Transcript_12395/m.35453 type:complete len:204 (-) Transcript_12395:462-1073(-)
MTKPDICIRHKLPNEVLRRAQVKHRALALEAMVQRQQQDRMHERCLDQEIAVQVFARHDLSDVPRASLPSRRKVVQAALLLHALHGHPQHDAFAVGDRIRRWERLRGFQHHLASLDRVAPGGVAQTVDRALQNRLVPNDISLGHLYAPDLPDVRHLRLAEAGVDRLGAPLVLPRIAVHQAHLPVGVLDHRGVPDGAEDALQPL